MPRRSAVPLVPIRKTRFAHRLIHGGAAVTRHRECWGAVTLNPDGSDGDWEFEREDSPGTPWLIYHKPSVADRSYTLPVDQYGSIRQCQMAVTFGWAAKALEQRKAEDRARAAERGCDPECRWPAADHAAGCGEAA